MSKVSKVNNTCPPPALSLPAYGPRSCRLLRGMTVAEVAAASHYSESRIRAVESAYEKRARGDKEAVLAPYNTARRIANVLNVPIDAFFRFPFGTRAANQSAPIPGHAKRDHGRPTSAKRRATTKVREGRCSSSALPGSPSRQEGA